MKNNPFQLAKSPLWILMLLAVTSGCSVLQVRTRPEGAIVPPHLEIEVLDPRTDPSGLPAVTLDPTSENGMQVDVSATILVFKYYYSGEREFQGPLLNGGSYIVTAKHPATGESVYLPVMLPAGSPDVRYTSKCIYLDYGNRGVRIVFGRNRPTVVYRNRPTPRNVIEKQQKSPLAVGIKRSGKYASGMAADGLAYTANAGETLLRPVQNIFRVMPMVSWLPFWDSNYVPGAYAKQFRAEKQRDAGTAQKFRSEATVPTNR